VGGGGDVPSLAAAPTAAVVRAWWLAARADGRCGQLLGHAAAKGLPWVRAWAASLAVWGAAGHATSLPGCDPLLEEGRCLPVAAVSERLDALRAAEPLGDDADEVAFIAHTLRHLASRTASPTAAPPEAASSSSAVAAAAASAAAAAAEAHAAAARSKLGVLVALRCGHNVAYSDSERRMLAHHLNAAVRSWGLAPPP